MSDNSADTFVSNDIASVRRNRYTLLLVCLNCIIYISAQSTGNSSDVFGAKDITVAFGSTVCHQAVIAISDNSTNVLSFQ